MIEPVEYRESLAGKSKSYIIKFSDGRDYAVKFMSHGFNRVLFNEWIAYCFARFLQLPVPYSTIVHLPEDFVRNIPGASDKYLSSYQFASLYISNSWNLHQIQTVPNVVNRSALAGVIVFDYWLCNRDRTRDNVVLSEDSTGRYTMWMVDHGDIFGSPAWKTEELGSLSTEVYKSAAHEYITSFIPREKDVFKYLSTIMTTPKLLMEEIIATAPAEWYSDTDAPQVIVQTLMHRRDKQLRPLLKKYIEQIYKPVHRR